MPEYDLAGLIVNDTTYGGSGGQFLLTSVNSASTEIANHEIGHTFAHLGDEYSTAFPGYPDVEEPNTTTNNTRALIKWNAWINAATPVPTPDVASNSTVVGLFEGAHYHTTGWYRPKHDCKMRTLGASYCDVCSQELVLSMYRLIRPIQSVSPATNSLVVSSEGSALFNLSVLKPTTTNLTVQWFTNGVLVPGATATNLVLNGAQLQTGTNQIKALVNDATTFVRTDPANNLWDTNVWTLSVIPAPAVSNLSLTTSGMGSSAFMFSTPTQVGLQYILEYKDAMLDPMWTPLETDPGTGGILNLTNLGITGPSRFFRIRVQ